VFKIAFARRSSRFSTSSSLSRRCWSVESPGLVAASIWAGLPQPRNVSRLMPNCSDTRLQAPVTDNSRSGSASRSSTRRIDRSRSSTGYFLGAGMTPPFRGINASTSPGAVHLVMAAPANTAPVHGTGGNDELRGTPFRDTIRGFGGNDRVHAFAGADHTFGGSGYDLVYADRGDDALRGGPKHDFLSGGQGADTIYAGAGRDSIGRTDGVPSGSAAGSDVIFGGAAHDFIYDGFGADTIHAGMGSDFVDLARDRTPDTVICGPGHDQVFNATSVNTVAADCEEVHVGPSAP
jgi:hypothetical protein